MISFVLAAAVCCAAEPVAKTQDIRKEVAEAEQSIDERFNSITDPDPITLLGRTRGAYLNEYGAVFSFQVMLVPVANVSPFRQSYTDEEKTKLNIRKRQRLEDLEARVHEILVVEGSRLQSIPVNEKVAVVVSFHHFPWENLTQLPSQLVVQATRASILDRKAGRIEKADFRKQLDVAYF